MKYLAFLNWLLSFGPQLPAIYAEIEKIIASVNAILVIVGKPTSPGELQLVQPTDEECAAEAQVAALVAGETAAFDGSRLRAIFKFYQENKALFDFLIGLIGAGA